MPFAELPDGFLIAGGHDWDFLAMFGGSIATIADKFKVAAIDGRNDRAVVRRREGECEQVEDSRELRWQVFSGNGRVFAVVSRFSPPFLRGRLLPYTHNTKNNKKDIYIKHFVLLSFFYIWLIFRPFWVDFAYVPLCPPRPRSDVFD
jgi:hypothetical protein